MAQDKEAFLSRWSRRKREAEKETPPAVRDDAKRAGDDKPAETPPGPQARTAEPPSVAAAPASELPSLDKLSSESDFGGFMKPGVDDNLRRAALKKLFTDPRFNVIDSMDIDIDDYSNLEKLSPEVAKTLAHAKRTLFGWDEKKEGEASAEERTADTARQQVADAREEEERSPARDGDDRRAQAGKDEQSEAGPLEPAKKG